MLLGTAINRDTGSRMAAEMALALNEYAADLNALGAAMLGNQLRALVALRQASLQVISDPTGLGLAAAEAQRQNGKVARYYLNAVLPKMVLLMAEASSMSDLMDSLNHALADFTAPDEAAQALAHVIVQMRDYESDSRSAQSMAGTSADISDNALRALDQALGGVVGRLDGQNADQGGRGGSQIAQAKAAVEMTEKSIAEAVDTILCKSGIGSNGAKCLVTRALSLPTSHGAGMEKAVQKGCGAIGEFPAEAIDLNPRGVTGIKAGAESGIESGIEEAQQAIRDGNRLLQGQYQNLASLGPMLAAVQAIRGQTLALSEAGRRLAVIASKASTTLAAIIGGVEALQERLIRGASVAAIAAQLNAAIFAWAELRHRTREIERTLSGAGRLFPEA